MLFALPLPISKIYISSPASTRIHVSALPGDGSGDLEPQTTTFNESSSSKKGGALLVIIFKPVFKILSCIIGKFVDKINVSPTIITIIKPFINFLETFIIILNCFYIQLTF